MIWEACGGDARIEPLSGTLFRLVESQAQVATLHYVDTLDEQALLEEMLESVKPPAPTTADALHYLLRTPFRYPPLRWGSRFGSTHEPGIFYGAHSTETTLAEAAYYRFVFWHSMEGAPPRDSIQSEHTLFLAAYRTQAGVKLQAEAFAPFSEIISHTTQYSQTQQLGTAMREAGVEVFEYLSARDPEGGVCVALFTPDALIKRKPRETSQWLCEVNARAVTFKAVGQARSIRFALDVFLQDGRLPFPA
jgi:hypothetical protein